MAAKSKKTKRKATNQWKLQLTTNNILSCLFYAVIGLLLLIMKGGSLSILMTIVGILFIAIGVIDAIQNKDLVKGVVEMVLGLAIIIFGWLIADIVLLVFGVMLIVTGFLPSLKSSLQKKLFI
jgi:hypothetical protein